MSSELLSLSNFPAANIIQLSRLNTDVAAGDTTFPAENADQFIINRTVVMGPLGSEKVDMRVINNVSGNTITISSLTYKHLRFEPLTVIRGRQIKVYRAANVDGTVPLDASFSSIATVDIQPDQLVTPYEDSSGGSGYWYKQTFLNPDLALETSLAQSVAVRGGDYGHYATIGDIREEAGFPNNPNVTDQNISDRRDDAESEIKGTLRTAGYTLPLAETPPTVRNVTKLLAAGYLLQQDYGVGAAGTSKEGAAKITLARNLLAMIADHTIQLLAITETDIVPQSNISGWPNDTTASLTDPDSHGGGNVIQMNQRF